MTAPSFAREAFLRPIVFTQPTRLVFPPSWIAHIPFAFWLVDALRPRSIVELGTMSGNSYAAFAQAVQILNLDARCYAVDTWQGDAHAGEYGEDVYREWSTFHDLHFGAFSRLVRSTFDEARGKFPDGTIDLLHIDGCHTYDAVKHDFDSWLPKLSPNAIVLLHDTNVREQDFGVWRFWLDVKDKYPTFEFLHGHGLGVVGIGHSLPSALRTLLDDVRRDVEESAAVRRFFSSVGSSLVRVFEDGALRRDLGELKNRLAEQQAALGAAAQDLAGARDDLARAEALRAEALRAEALRAEAARSNAATADARVEELQRDCARLASEVAQRDGVIETKNAELASARARIQQERARVLALHGQGNAAVDRWAAIVHRRTSSRGARVAAWMSGAGNVARESLRVLRHGRRRAPGSTPTLSSLKPRARQQRLLIESSGLFDRDAYVKLYPEVAETALDPVWHYLATGGKEGRQPHRLFDPAWYVSQAPAAAGSNLLVHYLEHGWKAGCSPHRLFDVAHYRLQVGPDGPATEPLGHYLTVGAAQGLNPHPLFSTSFYLSRNRDVAEAGTNPLLHYVQHGWREGRNPHPLFNTGYYLDLYADVAASDAEPLAHFLEFGAAEARNPNQWFDSAAYLAADAELRASGENPLIHFLRVGAAEFRRPGLGVDLEFYARANADLASSGLDPLSHYVLIGQPEGRRAHPADAPAAPGNLEASMAAYHRVATAARTSEGVRLEQLSLAAPRMITLAAADDLAARGREVQLRSESAPVVSVVIPVLNGIRFTLECLLSIVAYTDDPGFEVIVVDNGSTDDTQRVLSAIAGLVYVRLETNVGFGAACNAGANAARGRYLVMLNNDAQVTEGWLPPLIAPFASATDIGAVGPKVLCPDGRLQEAGVVLEGDCTSRMIGLHDDPSLPRFNRARDVDYVSGVCMAIETDRFRALDGFAPEFAPAYCEDADLCLRLRHGGLRTVYEPASTVVHHLSVTSNELGASFKLRAVRCNQQQLSTRHQADVDAMNAARVIAIYLPQFHPIPENDVWWGKGFTEWRNVSKARPNFEGHHQPRLPADLGYYDLRLADVYNEQTALARRYGIDGFCFYYYWFGGKRLLERPIERLVTQAGDDFPFCLCWANENWTRRWDGMEHDILMAQAYSEADNIAVIRDLMRYFVHPAYIRVKGRPLLLVYHASRFPDPNRTTALWRQECRDRGIGEVFLAMVQAFDLSESRVAPADWGFDAAVEFPPHQGGHFPVEPGHVLNPDFTGRVFDYEKTAAYYMTRPSPGFRRFRTVMPGWDNTARRQNDPVVFSGSTPGAYQAWLEWILRQAREEHVGDEQLVFINAWNEWAEGAYIEPDLGWGHGYLEATRDAVENVRLGLHDPSGK